MHRAHKSHCVTISHAIFNFYKGAMEVLFVGMQRTHEYCMLFISSFPPQKPIPQKTSKSLIMWKGKFLPYGLDVDRISTDSNHISNSSGP